MRFIRSFPLRAVTASLTCCALPLQIAACLSICVSSTAAFKQQPLPETCRDPALCAQACHRGNDPAACAWILAVLQGSRIEVLPADRLAALDDRICAADPARCEATPVGDDPEADGEPEASPDCDAGHPAACDRLYLITTCDEEDAGSCEKLESARVILLAECLGGAYQYCENAASAGLELDDGGHTARVIEAQLGRRCTPGDLPACDIWSSLLLRFRDSLALPDHEARVALARQPLEIEYSRRCSDGDFPACDLLLDAMYRLPKEEVAEYAARREALIENVRRRARTLMLEYLSLACGDGERPACAGAMRVTLANAAMGDDSSALEALLTSFEAECIRENRAEACAVAGDALLLRHGDDALQRARPLLVRGCGTGGCERLTRHLLQHEQAGSRGWRTREADDWIRRGCAAGESTLCEVEHREQERRELAFEPIVFPSCGGIEF